VFVLFVVVIPSPFRSCFHICDERAEAFRTSKGCFTPRTPRYSIGGSELQVLYYFAASLAAPMKISAVAALATASAVPIAMTTLNPETKDSSIARRISCWVAGS